MAKLHEFNCNMRQRCENGEGTTIPGRFVAAIKIHDIKYLQFEVEIPGKGRFEMVALNDPAEGWRSQHVAS
jgi:hypothetical protein